MKKFVKIFSICILVIVILAIGGYLLMANYYANGFAYGTYINGVYCTGKSVSQVNAELSSLSESIPVELNIQDKSYMIMPEEIDYRYDYEAPLKEYLDNQNPYLWGLNVGNAVNHDMAPALTLDEEKVRATVNGLNLKRINGPHNVKMYLSNEDGYILRDNKGTEIDPDKVIDKLLTLLMSEGQSVVKGEDHILVTIDPATVYKEAEYSKEEQKIIDLYEKIARFQDKQIRFDFSNGDSRTLNRTEVAGFISKDANGLPLVDSDGELVIDEDGVRETLNMLLGPYNTYQNHFFKTHTGEVVHVTKGTYGSKIDVESQVKPVMDVLISDAENYRAEIEFIKEPPKAGNDDIGDTYLEISIDEQHLYYFEGGKLKLDSDIVTGNHSHGSDTPKGVFDVFYKQRNRTLVGESYRSFVKYWINFAHHIGVHDASWRNEYGGDLYLYNGSHGCVNTPEEKVSKLYDMIELGTPVIVY